MFRIIFQDLDCAIAHKEKPDLMQSQNIPDIPQGKETYRERSTVQMVTIIIIIITFSFQIMYHITGLLV